MSGSAMFSSLQHRNARLFFLGLLVSNFGSWMQMTAVSLVVYDLTGNATDTGINLLCQFLPMLILGSWAGAIADRHDKRLLTIATQSMQAAQALLLGVLTLAHLTNLPVLYSLSLVLGIVGAFDNPARRAFVIELVEPEQISNAVSLNTAVMTSSRIVGPALAAFLVGPLGAGWLFILNGVSFLAILWPLFAIDRTKMHPSVRAERGGTPVRDAMRFIIHDRRLLVVFIVFTLVGAFAFNYSVSLLKISDVRFGDRRWFGILLASSGLGSMFGSLLTAARPRVTTRWFFGNGLLLGVSGLLLAWAPGPWAAVALSIPVGMTGAAVIAGQNAIMQQESPPNMRGRLLALSAVAFLGSTPVGAPITGWVADNVSAEWSLAYGSIITLVACSVGVVLRRSQRRDVPTHENEPTTVQVDGSHRSGVVPEAAGG
jgi:MFS family permease